MKNNTQYEKVFKAISSRLLLVIGGGIVFLFALPISLAMLGENLRSRGYESGEILKSKFFHYLGVLPLILVIIFYASKQLPQSFIDGHIQQKFIENIAPGDESGFREIIEEKKSKLDEAISYVDTYREVTQDNREIRDRLKSEIASTTDVEEKSEKEERFRENKEELQNLIQEEIENKNSIPVLEKELAIARADLKAFREGKITSFDKIPSVVNREAMEKDRDRAVSNFRWNMFWLSLLSIPFSSLLVFFVRSRNKNLIPLKKAAFWCDKCISIISYIGLLPLTLFSSVKSMSRDDYRRPEDAMILGHERQAFLTDKNLNYHTQIIGGSGSGKTNLLKVILEDRIAKGHSIIFFDLKADIELMDWIVGASSEYGRKEDLNIISMSDPKMSHAYNPIKHGTETEISSQLMNSLKWSESFYQNKSEGALLVILKALCYRRDVGGILFHLGDLYQFLVDAEYRMDLTSEVCQLNYPNMYRPDLKRISEELSTNKKDNYDSLITQISKILNSSAGEIVANKLGDGEEEFEFNHAMATGKIAYLFMNSLKLKETASIMGKLMLQDLMKAVGNIYDDRNAIIRPTTLVIDEFASFATPDFGEFIEKARGAGISIIVAYQSRKSLDHLEENLSLKINENTATKIIFQVQDTEDVEWFSSLLGTQKVEKETYSVESSIIGDIKTGSKSVREVEEFVVHPNVIKGLRMGQALLYCSKVDVHHVVMNILKANEYCEQYVKEVTSIPDTYSSDIINTDRPGELTVNDLI